jgi:predicted RNase H-like HicB family nuclease
MEMIEGNPVSKTPQQYLEEPYARVLIPNDDGTYSAQIMEFIGCYADGATPNEAIENLEHVALGWVEICLERGFQIPEPFDNRDFGGKVALRLPQSVHRQASWMAEQDGVSLNQFLVSVISQYVGAQSLFNGLMRKFEQKITTQLNFFLIEKGRAGTRSLSSSNTGSFVNFIQLPNDNVTQVSSNTGQANHA